MTPFLTVRLGSMHDPFQHVHRTELTAVRKGLTRCETARGQRRLRGAHTRNGDREVSTANACANATAHPCAPAGCPHSPGPSPRVGAPRRAPPGAFRTRRDGAPDRTAMATRCP